MKAIVLAAGEGRRMRPLTLKTPKPLLSVLGKPILEHALDTLPQDVTEVVLVVRYLGEHIKRYFGDEYRGKKIIYVDGSNRGTAYSFLATRDQISEGEKFLLMYGDEIPNPHDVAAILSSGLSAVVFHSERPEVGGVVALDAHGYIKNIEEKPKEPQSNLVIDGVMMLHSDIFNYQPTATATGEFYLVAMLNAFAQTHHVRAVLSQDFIGDITAPEDIGRVEKLLRARAQEVV